MARRAFYSFHYKADCFRASQVRNMGIIEGNAPATDNDWESVLRGKDAAIQKWIDDQLKGKSVAIVLIGASTAGRKWINYEITTAWNAGKGVFGIYIHNLRDEDGKQGIKGVNPFSAITLGDRRLDSVAHAYDPPFFDSKQAYGYIKENLAVWIEKAIASRGSY